MNRAVLRRFLDPRGLAVDVRRRLGPAGVLRVLFVLFLCLHAAKVVRLIPLERLADGDPLIGWAHSATLADVVRDRAFAESAGSAWGYDPFTATGVPEGLGLRPESTLPVLFDRIVRGLCSAAASYKLFVMAALFLGPLLLYRSARLFQLPAPAALVAAVMMSGGFVSHDAASSNLVYQGQIGFWLGTFVAIYNAGCLYAWSLHRRRRYAFVFAASAVALPACDPALGAAQIAPWIFITLMTWGPDRWRVAGCALFGGLLSAAVNLSWLTPFVESRLVSPAPDGWLVTGVAALQRMFTPSSGRWLERIHATTRAYLAVFAFMELVIISREKRRLHRVLWLWIAALVAIGFFCPPLPIFSLAETARFSFVLTTLLLIPAATFMTDAFLRPGTLRIVLFVWYLWFSVTWQLVHPHNPRPIPSRLNESEQSLMRDLDKIPAGERVLVQFLPRYADALRLAAASGRHTFAGFGGPWWNDPYGRQATFTRVSDDWTIFGRPVREYARWQLAERLRRHDVRHVVATTEYLQDVFSRIPAFERTTPRDARPYAIFRLRRPAEGGYFLEGSGDLSLELNRIRIANMSSGTVAIAFRWVDGLRADPPLNIRPYVVDGERAPFIAIENPSGVPAVEVTGGG